MSLLDTFYILFKSDTSDLKKGAEEAERVTKGLDNSLQRIGHDSEHIGGSFLSMAKSAKAFLLSAIPAGFAAGGIHSAIDFGVELAKTGRILNANVEDLNAWRNAVELAGGDANQFQGTIASLADKFNVSSQTILKILPRYADALSRLNPASAQRVGKNLGLDEGTILLLQRSRREVESMIKSQKELGIVTQRDAVQFLMYNEATTKVKQSTQALFTVIALEALPYLIRFYDIIQKGIRFFIQHKDFVIGGFIAIGAAVAAFGIRMALANLPLYLMSALIVGLIGLFALVYDDIQAFNKGQNSLIGYIINNYPKAAQIAKEAFDVIRSAINSLIHPLDEAQSRLDKLYSYFTKKLASLKPFQINLNASNEGASFIPSVPFLQAQAAGGGNLKTTNVTVGDVTVNTQATDSHGLATNLKTELYQQFSQVANFFADGVKA